MPGGRVRELAKGVALAAVVQLVLLLAAEAGIRLWYHDVTTTSDNTSWFARRWQRDVRSNGLGFREREVGPREAGVGRIAVVGDSFAFGQGIPEEDRFSNRLEAMLARDAPDRRFEVLNFGFPGANTVDEVKTVRDVVLPAQPDFVLLQWYLNDVEGRGYAGYPQAWRLIPSDRVSGWLHGHSALYYFARTAWKRLQERLGWVQSYEDFLVQRFEDADSPSSRAADADLRQLIALCREAGKPLAIALFPTLGGLERLDFVRDRALAICRETSTPCLDLKPALLPRKDEPGMRASRLDSHPGPRANEIAAEEIYAFLEPRWFATPGAVSERSLR